MGVTARAMAVGERITSDVCVIGGGPSGSTIAHRLASFGHDVCLVERHAFPRPHIGASLPPTILPLLEFIGVRDRVESAGFLRPERIVVWWSEAVPTVRSMPGPPGFHVDRGAFDRLLLQNAKANGVRVLQPAQAMQPVRLSGGQWRISLRHQRNLKEIISRFVVDASGGRDLLGARRNRVSASLLALYAQWRGVDDGELGGRVEAGEQEWFWYAPLGRERSVAAVFIDPKRLSSTHRESIESIYERLLRQFRLFPERQCGRIEGEVKACDASSRYAEEPVGPDFVRIGDAAFTLDPLSSQGVQSAIASALQAAIIVNTLAKYPANSEAAIAFYRDRQKEKVQQHARRTALFYRERAAICDQPFWRQRGVFVGDAKKPLFEEENLEATCRIQLSNMTTIERTPVIQGDTVVSTLAVRHETLERPVAFLGEVDLVPLLRQIRSGQTAEAIVQTWSERLSVELSWKIMRWLWYQRIVVPISTDQNLFASQPLNLLYAPVTTPLA
jgi:flavin-dependent dehydrogenase